MDKNYLKTIHYKQYVKKLHTNQKYEESFCFDKKGNLLTHTEGWCDGIDFTDKERAIIYEDGFFFIHNHPVNDWGLSLPDILFAVNHNIDFIEAVSSLYIYTLHIASSDFIDNSYQLAIMIEDLWLKYNEGVTNTINRNESILKRIISFMNFLKYKKRNIKQVLNKGR